VTAWAASDIRRLRQRFGLEAADFAKLLGVDVRTIYRWESGSAQPSGAAEAVMNGLREKLQKDPSGADAVIKFLVGAAAVGGLAYLIVKLLDSVTGDAEMPKRELDLPDDLLAALRNPAVEVAGEQRALKDILTWIGFEARQVGYREAEPVLSVDQFAWHAALSNTSLSRDSATTSA